MGRKDCSLMPRLKKPKTAKLTKTQAQKIVERLNKELPKYTWAEMDCRCNIRIYFRRMKGGRKTRMRAEPISGQFWTDYGTLMEGGTLAATTVTGKLNSVAPALLQIKPRTIGWLIQDYLTKSIHYTMPPPNGLDESTRRARRGILMSILDERSKDGTPFGEIPLEEFRTQAIKKLRDRKVRVILEQPVPDDGQTAEDVEPVEKTLGIEAANGRVKALRQVLAHGIEEHGLERNWAREVSYLRSNSEGHETPTLEDLEQFEKTHPIGTKAHLCYGLMLFTSSRVSDAQQLGHRHIQGGWLHFRQKKNENRKPIDVEIPILPPLRRILDTSELGSWHFLETEFGKPFTVKGLGNKMRDWLDEAGLQHLTSHGLRKACTVKLVQMKCTPHQIMAITGHTTMKEIERYTRKFLKREAAQQVNEMFLKEWLEQYHGAA
jgi:integrase